MHNNKNNNKKKSMIHNILEKLMWKFILTKK